MQRFHQDYSDSELRGRRAGPTPWSADIPLVKGGLYLNIWHGWDPKENKEFVGNRNFVLHVPLGYVLRSFVEMGFSVLSFHVYMLPPLFILISPLHLMFPHLCGPPGVPSFGVVTSFMAEVLTMH
jgi:hypothetical protein